MLFMRLSIETEIDSDLPICPSILRPTPNQRFVFPASCGNLDDASETKKPSTGFLVR